MLRVHASRGGTHTTYDKASGQWFPASGIRGQEGAFPKGESPHPGEPHDARIPDGQCREGCPGGQPVQQQEDNADGAGLSERGEVI